jgi:class 3 adenylate cyclase/tetratricopeptide (TPR) repeat protein
MTDQASAPTTSRNLTKRLAVIFYADASQYTRLTRLDEERTHTALVAKLDLLASVIRRNAGNPVQTAGDSLLAEFSTLRGAVTSAVEAQKELAELAAKTEGVDPLKFRIGINIGDVIVARDTIYGDGVNLAERLQGLARPGEIYVSEAVYRAIEDSAPWRFRYIGEHSVKNIDKPVRAYRLSEVGEADQGSAAATSLDGSSYVTVVSGTLNNNEVLERTRDLEQVHRILNQMGESFGECIARFGGTPHPSSVHEFTAVFGAPESRDNDPERAIRAALDFVGAVGELGEREGVELALGVGIDCGEAIVSASSRSGPRVTGMPMSTAGRIARASRESQVLISQRLRDAIASRFACEDEEELVVGSGEQIDRLRVWKVAGPSHLSELETSKFVGRRRELRQMEGILNSTLEDGSGGVVYIRGEAGIGKTTLLRQLTTLAGTMGYQCHVSSVSDFGVHKGYDALGSLLLSLLDIGRERNVHAIESSVVDALEDGLLHNDEQTYLYDILQLPQPPSLKMYLDATDDAQRERGRGSLTASVVRRAAERSPVVVALEDVHWADNFLLSVLAEIASAVRDHPVVLVMTSRLEHDPLDASWRGKMSANSLLTLDLGPLRATEAWELATDITDGDESFVQECIQSAGGNPFFLVQLLRRDREAAGLEIPVSILGVIRWRMDRLAKVDKTAVQAASVIGRRFSDSMLRFILDERDYDLARLVDGRLVRADGDEFRFDHDLIRESANRSLLSTQRRHFHKRAADFLVGRDTALRAQHLERAEDPEAPRAYLEAAREHANHHRNSQALALIERGLTLVTDRADRFELTCLQGQLKAAIGEMKDSTIALNKAFELAATDVERSRLLLSLAGNLALTDNYPRAFEMLADAEAVFQRHGLVEQLAALHCLRGNLHFPQGNIERCYDEHSLALQYAVAAKSPEAQARALSGLGDAEYARGRMQSAGEQFRKCVDLAVNNGLGRIEVENRHMIASCSHYLISLDRALTEGQEALEAALRASHHRAELCSHSCLSVIQFDRGQLEDVIDHVDRAQQLAISLGARRFEPLNLTFKAKVSRLRGERAAAAKLIDIALTISREVGMAYNGPRVLSELALISQDSSTRWKALEEGEAILRTGCIGSNHLWFYRDAIQVALEERDFEAIGHYVNGLQAYTGSEELPWARFLCEWGRLLNDAAGGSRDPSVGRRLEKLCDQAEAAGMRLLAGQMRETGLLHLTSA